MARNNQHFLVKVNNTNNIEELLQELYDLANNNNNQLQGEINKIANTTVINDLDIDGKEKYAKVMSGYLTLIQKCISQKMEIAKLLTEILKVNGNVKKALEDNKDGLKKLDFKGMRAMSEKSGMDGDTDFNSTDDIGKETYYIGRK